MVSSFWVDTGERAPLSIFFVFTRQNAVIGGDYTLNPFQFDHLNLSDCYFTVGATDYPTHHIKPIKWDKTSSAASKVQSVYYRTLKAAGVFGTDREINLDYSDFCFGVRNTIMISIINFSMFLVFIFSRQQFMVYKYQVSQSVTIINNCLDRAKQG